MQIDKITDVTIIGAGPIGLFSIFQAGMLGMKTCVIDSREEVGGQCSALYPEKPIYDIPAIPKILASDFIEQLCVQAAPFEPSYYLNQQAISCVPQEDSKFLLSTSNNVNILTKVILIAAGSGAFGPNKPPLDNIEQFEGKSVLYAIKKREMFRDKVVVIAGGGDSAVDWAISLSEITKKIYLVHRRDKFKATPESIERLHNIVSGGKIELVVGYQLSALEGKDGYIENVIVSDLNKHNKVIPADFLCPFFGLVQSLGPMTHWGLQVKNHHIEVKNPSFETNIAGIYAVGDVVTYDGKLKLILTGFAEVASALHHAYSKVFTGKALHFQYSTTKGVPLQ